MAKFHVICLELLTKLDRFAQKSNLHLFIVSQDPPVTQEGHGSQLIPKDEAFYVKEGKDPNNLVA